MNEKRVTEEVFFEDVIRLSDFEQSGVCFSKFTVEDPGYLLDISNEDIIDHNETMSSYRKQPAMIPVTFFNVARNVKLLSECRPLLIRLIDCKKYSNFYKENEEKKRYNNPLNDNIEELSSDDVIFIDEYISKEKFDNVERSDEKFISYPEKITKYTRIQNYTKDHVKNIVFEEPSKNELYSKTTSETVYNIDTNARVIEKACQKLQSLVKSPTNVINNNYMSQPDIKNADVIDKNKIFSKQSDSIEKVVNSALDRALEKSSGKISLLSFENQNIEPSFVKEAQITRNYDQITDSGIAFKKAMKDNKEHVIENKNVNGSCSPILLCPLKRNNNTVQRTSNISTFLRQPHENSDITCTKKIFSDKRVLPHYHEVSLSNHLNTAHIKKVSENKKKEYTVPYTNLIKLLKRPIQMNTNITYNENQRKGTHNYKKVSDFPTQSNSTISGYSPPILPIPTYEKTFEVLSKIQHNFFKSTSNQSLNLFQTPAPDLAKKRKMNNYKEINDQQCL